MLVEELRGAWWKLAAAALLVLMVVLTVPVPTPYKEIVNAYDASVGPLEIALQEMFALYTAGGFFVLIPLAAFLGGTAISSEVGGNTVYLLLSKPVSRWRLLLTKYAVCAAILMVAAVSGGVLIVVVASASGYPLDLLSVTGLVFSAGLMWLGTLFVLGLGFLVSIYLRSKLGSVVATLLVAYSLYSLPFIVAELTAYSQAYLMNSNSVYLSYDLAFRLTLFDYWSSEGLFTGESFAATNFVVCLTAAALPLLAALWFFNRKAY